MKEVREKVNHIDEQILKLLAERRELSLKIVKLKNEEKSIIRDKVREKELLTRLIERGREIGLDSHYVSKIFYEIVSDSVKLQNQFVLNEGNKDSLCDRSLSSCHAGWFGTDGNHPIIPPGEWRRASRDDPPRDG